MTHSQVYLLPKNKVDFSLSSSLSLSLSFSLSLTHTHTHTHTKKKSYSKFPEKGSDWPTLGHMIRLNPIKCDKELWS